MTTIPRIAPFVQVLSLNRHDYSCVIFLWGISGWVRVLEWMRLFFEASVRVVCEWRESGARVAD